MEILQLIWIQFAPEHYVIKESYIYTTKFRLLPDIYAFLISQYQKPLEIPFVKITYSKATNTSWGNPINAGVSAVIPNVIEMNSTTKQAYTKIDSVFITFHPNEQSKAICAQPYIKDFKLTTEDAGNQKYPGGGIIMRTWNDEIQYNMLLDALNFNNNMIAGLPSEYLNSCRPMTIITNNVVAANTAMVKNQTILNIDTTNFLLGIPFAADSSHMEGLSRTGNDINWILEGIRVQYPFKGATAGHGVNIENMLTLKIIVYSAVCDWNIRLSASYEPVPNQTYSTQVAFNI
jgi:hypothetical protein